MKGGGVVGAKQRQVLIVCSVVCSTHSRVGVVKHVHPGVV